MMYLMFPPRVFFSGCVPRSVVACRSGEFLKGPDRIFERFCEYLSEDHAVDHSLTCWQLGRAYVGCGHQFTVVNVFWCVG